MNTSNFFYCFNVSFGCCEFRLLLYIAYIVVNGLRCHMTTLNFGVIIILTIYLPLNLVVGLPVLTRAYDNNGRCPRHKLVFGILQLPSDNDVSLIFIIKDTMKRYANMDK